MNEKILIIDDEIELADIVGDYLLKENYKVYKVSNGCCAMEIFDKEKPNLLVLDLMLPDIDGMEFCRLIRLKSDVPIIIMSAKVGDIDKVLALGFGADDYMTKPLSPLELVARIKAHLRRYQKSLVNERDDILDFGVLKIYPKSYQVELNSNKMIFSAKEFEVLEYLARNKGQVFSKEQIFNAVWGFDDFGDTSTVTVHIRRIRAKLEQDKNIPNYITTVWGVGYKFEAY